MSTTHTFARTDEQELLAENVARLLSETHSFEATRRQPFYSTAGHSDVWPALAELGVIGAAFDERHGGFAGDTRTIAVVMAELGAALVLEPFMETAVLAGRIFQHWADDSARAAALEALMSGTLIVVLAHTPTGKAEASVTASQSHDRTMLTGGITCVRYAPLASNFLIPAVASDGSTEIYQVPRECSGLVLETYRLIDGSTGADLQLRDVKIPETARMRFDTNVQAVLDDALEWGVLASVAETASILQALNNATFSYLTTRKQFGAPLASFQALQHRASDMYIAAEETFAVVDEAIESFGSGPARARSTLVSAAKVVADNAARNIGDGAVQLHGGMGVSDELIVSHYARRLIALRCGFGGADAHRLRFGGLLQ
jgi:alkylation response protein AidB-like acyl-CoA dehydrogenase